MFSISLPFDPLYDIGSRKAWSIDTAASNFSSSSVSTHPVSWVVESLSRIVPLCVIVGVGLCHPPKPASNRPIQSRSCDVHLLSVCLIVLSRWTGDFWSKTVLLKLKKKIGYIFTDSALWAELVIESRCPYVRPLFM